MSLNTDNARTAIVELLEGDISSATVTAGMFAYGVFDGQPLEAMQAAAVQTAIATHRFDVQFTAFANHASTTPRMSSRRLVTAAVTIPIWSHVATTAQETDRSAVLASIGEDMAAAMRALGYPQNLALTVAAEETAIVGGMLHGPGGDGFPRWRVVSADWNARLIRSEIAGSLILDATIFDSTPPDPTSAYPDPDAPADIDANLLSLGPVSPTFAGWTTPVALKTFDDRGQRLLKESADDGAILLETVEDYRNVEISFFGMIPTVYLRLSAGRAYYCSLNVFGSNVALRCGVAVNVASDDDSETHYELAILTGDEIPGWPSTAVEAEIIAAFANDMITFGCAGHEVYLKRNGVELLRFPAVLHPNVSGTVAIRNIGFPGYGLLRASVALVPTALYSNTLIDVRDLGVKTSALDVYGSIAEGSAVLAMQDANHGYEVDDVLIVEPTQSRGDIDGGPGGRFPEQSYPDAATIMALPDPGEEGVTVMNEADGHNWTWNVSSWFDQTLESQAYYWALPLPKPLVATVLAVNGANITLDATAAVTTTNARVFVEALADLQDLIGDPSSYPKAHPDVSVDVSAIWQPIAMRFPAGNFATAGGALFMVFHADDVIDGAGPERTILYTPNFCESAGIAISQDNDSLISDIGVRGTFQLEGAGWDMTTDVRPFGQSLGTGPTFPKAFAISGSTGSRMENIASTNGWTDCTVGTSSSGCIVTGLKVTQTDPAKMYMGMHVNCDTAVDSEIHLDEFDSNYNVDAMGMFNSDGCEVSCAVSRNAETHINGSRNSRFVDVNSVYELGARAGTYIPTVLQYWMAQIVNHISAPSPNGNGYENCTFVSHESVLAVDGFSQGHAWTGGYLTNCVFQVAGSANAFYHDGAQVGVVAIDGCTFIGGRVHMFYGSVANSSGPLLEYDPDGVTLGGGNTFTTVTEI